MKFAITITEYPIRAKPAKINDQALARGNTAALVMADCPTVNNHAVVGNRLKIPAQIDIFSTVILKGDLHGTMNQRFRRGYRR
jgi:hypothetical protein